jgi:hypothetical protein
VPLLFEAPLIMFGKLMALGRFCCDGALRCKHFCRQTPSEVTQIIFIKSPACVRLRSYWTRNKVVSPADATTSLRNPE